jgi:hypothetical protein
MRLAYLFIVHALLFTLAACSAPTASAPTATAPEPAPATAAPTIAPTLADANALPTSQTAEGYQTLGSPDAPLTLTMYSDFL